MSAAFILHFDEIQNSSPRHLEFWSNDVFGHTICFLVVYCTFLQKCEKFVHPAAIFFFAKMMVLAGFLLSGIILLQHTKFDNISFIQGVEIALCNLRRSSLTVTKLIDK